MDTKHVEIDTKKSEIPPDIKIKNNYENRIEIDKKYNIVEFNPDMENFTKEELADAKKEYFKVINLEHKHHDYEYTKGLNKLKGKFKQHGSCCAGRLYFTKLKHIQQFYGYGCYLYVVTLPKNDPDFQMVQDPKLDKWGANMIILGNKYSLLDPRTYKLFGLNMEENNYIIDLASEYGLPNVLDWCFKKSGLKFKYSGYAIDCASGNGHVHVLEWWKSSGLELKYSEYAIDVASKNGHVNVLAWWKNSGLKLEYSDRAIYLASGNDHVDALEWWLKSGLELKYSEYAIFCASMNGHVNVLEWWKKSGLELKYSENAINYASMNGHVHVLEWWLKSGLKLKYDENAIGTASKNGHVHVLRMVVKIGVKIKI